VTPDERQALREKHKLADYDIEFCDFCEYRLNGETYPVEYPCDVIKVLDATEPKPKCDNHDKYLDVGIYVACPKCGEKL
jgi:predicted RNA-binding Zn-ribbon protein involved in translation (DUF1610 family)